LEQECDFPGAVSMHIGITHLYGYNFIEQINIELCGKHAAAPVPLAEVLG
jgi:hypothetical protein